MGINVIGLDENITTPDLNAVERKPVWNSDAPPGSNPSVTTQANFDKWYRDGKHVIEKKLVYLLGYNESNGTWTYGGPNFFPFDSSPPLHNYYFTCEFHGWFTYDSGAGMYVTYRTDDDGWVFINNVLVADIGGIHLAISKTVYLNTLGLIDGKNYTIDIFFAERLPITSELTLNTNVCAICSHPLDLCGTCLNEKIMEGYRCEETDDDDGDEDDEDDGDDGGGEVECSERPSAASLEKSLTCSVDLLSFGRYRFGFSTDLENPAERASALIVTPYPYNGNVRKRGTCDSRGSNFASAWSDTVHLWTTSTVLGSGPSVQWWTSTSLVSSTVRNVLYEVLASAEDLRACEDFDGAGGFVTRRFSFPETYRYSGTWHVTRASPLFLSDESAGEVKLFERVCSFRIDENAEDGSASAAVVQVRKKNHEGPSVGAVLEWPIVRCGTNGTLIIVVRTCVHVVGNADDFWAELMDPVVSFDSFGELHPNFTATVRQLCSSSCSSQRSKDRICCQDWEIVVSPTDEGSAEEIHDRLIGSFFASWRAVTYWVGYSAENHHRIPWEYEVSAALDANVTLPCGEDEEDAEEIFPIAADLNGTLTIYVDPERTDRYDVADDPPFLDEGTVYLRLVPDVDSEDCETRELVVDKVVMLFDSNNGRRHVFQREIVYSRNSPHINAVHDSSANFDESDCFSNVAFKIFKPPCGEPCRIEDDDIFHNENVTDSEPLWIWDGKNARWVDPSQNPPPDQKKRWQERPCTCRVKIIVYWELATKERDDDDDEGEREEREREEKEPKTCSVHKSHRWLDVRCNDDQVCDDDRGRCSHRQRDGRHHLFNFWWVFLVFVLVFSGILFCLLFWDVDAQNPRRLWASSVYASIGAGYSKMKKKWNSNRYSAQERSTYPRGNDGSSGVALSYSAFDYYGQDLRHR